MHDIIDMGNKIYSEKYSKSGCQKQKQFKINNIIFIFLIYSYIMLIILYIILKIYFEYRKFLFSEKFFSFEKCV